MTRLGCISRYERRRRGRRPGSHPRLQNMPIERLIDLRHARDRGETALVRRIVAAERANVV